MSVTTVSHVLNGTRHVSDYGRARVEAAIRQLGYVPSAIARSLKSNHTRTLGMLIPNSSNPYFAEVVHSVENRCFGAGYNLILCNTHDEAQRQSSYLQVLAERRIDGLIVVTTGQDAALARQLEGLGVPTVLVDREIEVSRQPCDLVETAHREGGRLATRHLLWLGHRRIACIGGPRTLLPACSASRAGATRWPKRAWTMAACCGTAISPARAATRPCKRCWPRRARPRRCSWATT